jgi:hypothetical protein
MNDWVQIPGYEGSYEITQDGRVRGIARLDARGRKWPGKLLSFFVDKDGYSKCALTKNRVTTTKFVHKLVLFSFRGPPKDGQVACHNNGDPGDNRVSNLRWGSLADNWLDSQYHGRRSNGYNSYITQVDTERAKDLRASGVTAKVIAKWLSISQSTVSNMITGRCRFAPQQSLGQGAQLPQSVK